MHCFEMKLKNRFRADRKHQSYSTSSSALLNNREASSSLDKDSRLPVDKGMDSPVPPKRDRSRSLCVDRIGPLIQVEPKASDDATKTTAIFARRCSTNALSASSDFISRRGVFSRRHYGSVEMLPQIETEGNELNGRRFRVENGESHGDREEMYGSPTTPVLENPEYQTRWYFKYFLGKLHQNYVGIDYDKAPFFLSVVLSNANNQRVPQYHAILWRKTGAQKISLCYTPNKPMTVKLILSNFTNMEKLEKGPKEIFSQDIQKDLLLLEEQEGSVNFKFGILYMLPGQTSDDEILSNEKGSKQFDNFLNLLGDKIRLKGWDKYRGGLDVKGDMTGKYSIYTVYEGHEVMFHVSTLLPFSRDNKQQVERKRHIGNDIVNIVFLDQTTDAAPNFSPSFIRSQFTHVFALVSLCALDNSYRLQVFSEETVPLFGSSLPSPAIFTNHQEFREFLLVKLINGEKATFNTPTFSQKRERTLEMLIKDICQEHMSETRGTMLNRRAFSDVLPDPPRSSRRKEEARQVEFVRYGQALKLDTIVRGDAPTSLATTGLFKRTPWEPLCCYPDFPYEIVCGDSWGTSRLFVASAEGVYLIEEGLQHKAVFDRSVVVKQLNVAEAHGILLIRVDKGRDSKIHVFRLSDFESDINVGNEEKLRSKVDIKEHRLERTKGCHLYSISKPGGSHLRMVVVVGKKLLILQWRHSAAWTAWCPASDTDTVEGFLFLREISLPETPSLLTLIDSPFASSAGGLNDNQICVGYKHHWDLVSERTGESSRLYCVEASKINLVAAIDIYEDDEAELLLCNNNICHFQKLSSPDSSSEFDFHWNSVPTAIVCAFPYIMAFTHDSIEIRLVINGNLVQTMVMPSLTFITSKADIFFATTAPEFISLQQDAIKVDKTERDSSLSPPPSPTLREVSGERAFSFERDFSPGSSGNSATQKPFRIYRIPFASMTGIGRCDRRCPTPSTHLHQNVLPGEGNRNVGPSKDNNKEIKDRKNEKESEKNYNKDEGEDESKSEMHLQVGNQSYSSRSCSASPTRHLGALPPFPPSANKNTPLSPLKCPSNSPARGTTRQRNRTNSLTVEMGSFPFRPIPQKHSFTHHNQQTPK